MPSNITFVKLTKNTSVPLRIFINRKRIMSTSPVSINEKSIIKLTTMNILKLSNTDLNHLLQDVSDQIIAILTEVPLIELYTGPSSLNKVVRDDLGQKWHAKLITSFNYIVSLRFRLNCLSRADLNFINEKKINYIHISNTEMNRSVHLIKRDMKFKFAEEGEDDFEPKKSFDYKLRSSNLLNSKGNNGIDLYVYKRPSTLQ